MRISQSIFCLLLLALLFSINSSAADRFWVGGNGNWNTNANWSATSGGPGGVSVPSNADDVFFDTNSFSGAGQTVTLNVNAVCNNMDWTGAINNPTFSGAVGFTLTISGTSFVLIDPMTYSVLGGLIFDNTGNLTLDLSTGSKVFGSMNFSASSARTIDINGNASHSVGRIQVGNSAEINFNGTVNYTIDGFFSGTNVLTSVASSLTLTDTLSTGYDNSFIVATGTSNSFQTVLVGEVDNGGRNYRFQGANVFNGEVITADDYQNTDRLHFYNSVFNDKVTITAPDGRAQFRSNSVFNDTLMLEFNTSVRFFDVDTFNSVVIITDDNFFYLSQNNNAADFSVFNDSVFFGPNLEFRSYRTATFNEPVNFAGNDGNGSVRRFNDGGGIVTFNAEVYFGNGAGSNSSRWTFERQAEFNADVLIGNNTFLYFGDGNGTTNFNDNVTIGNNNDIFFERNFTIDSLAIVGNSNTISALNTCDFALTNIGDLNNFVFSRNVDFNDDVVFGDTNNLAFGELGGEIDVFSNMTFGEANTMVFNRRVDFSPASPGDSLFFGRLSVSEFRLSTANNFFEDFILDDEARATFKNGTNRFDNITINDFSTLELSGGGLNTVIGDFVASESCGTPPIVRSGTGGQRAVIDFTGSAQNWSNVIVQDLEVTTSNLLTIDAAVNNGNLSVLDDATAFPGPPALGTTIWITNDRAGTTLYWVGSSAAGAGIEWTNASNWSTSSGGPGSICIPTPKDNVVFDANSFNGAGEKVQIDASLVICNDMTWSGVFAGATLEGNFTNTIFITGDLTLDANMTNDFTGGFEFNANDNTVRTIDPNGIDFEGPLSFNYLGGNWEFADNVSANGTVRILDGTVDVTTNDYNLTISGAGNDLALSGTGELLARDCDVNVSNDVSVIDTTSLTKSSGVFDLGGDLRVEDEAIFSFDAGSLTIGGGFDASDDVVLEFDTLLITVGNTWNVIDDVVLNMDSCNATIGGAMNGRDDSRFDLGGSFITINGGDFYLQENAYAELKNGNITVNGDQFYLDQDAQFFDTAGVIIANDDVFLDDNTVFNGYQTAITVETDDFYMRSNSNFLLTNGTLVVLVQDLYVDANGTAVFDSCQIMINDDLILQNTSTNSFSNFTSIDMGGDLNMDNTALANANNTVFNIGGAIDMDAGCTFNEGISTVIMDENRADVNIRTRGENLYNLIIDKVANTHDVRIINNSFVVGNDLHILNGELWDSDEGNSGPFQITGNTSGTGTFILTANGSLRLGDNNGGSDAPTTFPTGWPLGSITISDSSTVHYRQRLIGTNQIVASFIDYGNLFLDNSNGPNFVKELDGPVTINGTLFIDDNVHLVDSGFQITGNVSPGTEFEMDNGSIFSMGSQTVATTLPTFTARDWDQRSTIDYHAGVAQTVVAISGGGSANSYGHLTISNTDPNPLLTDKTLAGPINVRRQLNINAFANLFDDGFQITGNTTGDDLTMAANSQLTLGNSTANSLFPTGYSTGNISLDPTSLIVYNSTLDQDISASPIYANIRLSSTGSVIKSQLGDLNIDGDLTIDAQNSFTSTASNYDIDISGNWVNNGLYSPNNGTVTFEGSNYSTVSGSTQTNFGILRINNSASDSALGLFQRTIVLDNLILSDGIITTRSSNELVMADNGVSSAGSNQSHVDGPMMKAGDDDFNFPLGDQGIWARFGISNMQNGPLATDTFVAEYFRGLHPEAFWDSLDYVGDPGGLHNTSILEYWEFDRVFGNAQPFVRLFWEDNTQSIITDTLDLTIAHYLGANVWFNEGGVANGLLAAGSVRSAAAVTSFSPFTFGSTSETGNPLPIELLSFTAEKAGLEVELKWTTLSETNNDFFTIERSNNARDFEVVDVVKGAGNSREKLTYQSTDFNPLNGLSYYRLKQTDFDGKLTYSSMRSIRFDASNDLIVFPSPSSEDIVYINETRSAWIINGLGEEIMRIERANFFDASPLPKGMYFLLTDQKEVVKFIRE